MKITDKLKKVICSKVDKCKYYDKCYHGTVHEFRRSCIEEGCPGVKGGVCKYEPEERE